MSCSTDSSFHCTDDTSTCSCAECQKSSSTSSCAFNFSTSCSSSNSSSSESSTSSSSCPTVCDTPSSSNCCDTSVSNFGSLTLDTVCSESECNDCCDTELLSDKPDVFIYDKRCIHTNLNRGLSSDIPLVLGANKLSKVTGVTNYKPVLAVEGDIYVSGHVYSGGFDKVCGHHYVCSKANEATYHHVSPSDKVDTIFVNSIHGPVYVVLGNNNYNDFNPNQTITIKDCTLLYNNGSSHHIYVTVPTMSNRNNQVFIEHYDQSCRLKISGPGTYILNTSNGSVTFKYCKTNDRSCWFLTHQTVGNHRILPNTSLNFVKGNEKHVKKLLC